MSTDRVEPVRLERVRRWGPLDDEDFHVLAQVLDALVLLVAALVLLVAAAAVAGAAVRAFLWASGLGG